MVTLSMDRHHSRLCGIYAITDPLLCPQDRLLVTVEQALQGGIRLLQYRDKVAHPAQRLDNALRLRALCEQYDACLIINDDVALCLAVDAHGVHLGRSDGDVAQARLALGPDRILGVTCHSDLNYAQQATAVGADYCAFGRLFASRTKPDAPACSPQVLAQAKKLGLRTVAIGGIDLSNMAGLLALQPDMLALIHGLFGQKNIKDTAHQLVTMAQQHTPPAYPN